LLDSFGSSRGLDGKISLVHDGGMQSIPRKPLYLPSGQERTPTEMQVKALEKLIEGGRTKGEALREVGYSEAVATQPGKVFGSPTLIALMDEIGGSVSKVEMKTWMALIYKEIGMGEDELGKKHKLLNATRLDHMLFPTGPKEDTDDPDELSDNGIRELLASVNCTVRRIIHGEQARHVYFWSADNKARKEALDMAYNLRGSYAPKKTQSNHLVGVFSMSDLRRKLKEHSINIIQNDDNI
jgi:hypothetical protein